MTKTSETHVGRIYPNKTYSGILECARLNQMDVIPKVTAYATRIHAVSFTPAFWINRQVNWNLNKKNKKKNYS